mgnify:CR=1 FL=1
MITTRRFRVALTFTALLLLTPLPVLAQGQGPEEHHPENESGSAASPVPGGATVQGLPQGAMADRGAMPMMDSSGAEMDMMDCPMMAQMMRKHTEMMAMMHAPQEPGGMMADQDPGSGAMMGHGGTSLDSGAVARIEHFSIEDVRHFFEHRLRRIGNDRLKLGPVTQTNEDTITVDIVTVDDSLVDRLEVDRHSGAIQRAQ